MNEALFAAILHVMVSIGPYESIAKSQYPTLIPINWLTIPTICINIDVAPERCHSMIASSRAIYIHQQNVLMYQPHVDFSTRQNQQILAHEIVHVLQKFTYQYTTLDANRWATFELEANRRAREYETTINLSDAHRRDIDDAVSTLPKRAVQ